MRLRAGWVGLQRRARASWVCARLTCIVCAVPVRRRVYRRAGFINLGERGFRRAGFVNLGGRVSSTSAGGFRQPRRVGFVNLGGQEVWHKHTFSVCVPASAHPGVSAPRRQRTPAPAYPGVCTLRTHHTFNEFLCRAPLAPHLHPKYRSMCPLLPNLSTLPHAN